MPLQHFLIVYNIAEAHLVTLREFGADIASATAAYAELENEYQDRRDLEIVLVGADSLDTVHVTHSRYFSEGALVPFSA